MLFQCSEGWCPPAICKEVAPRGILSNPPHSNGSQEFCKITFPFNNVVWGDEVTSVDCSGSFFYSPQFSVLYQVPSVVTAGLKVGWSHLFPAHVEVLSKSSISRPGTNCGMQWVKKQLDWDHSKISTCRAIGSSLAAFYLSAQTWKKGLGEESRIEKLKESRWWPIK